MRMTGRAGGAALSLVITGVGGATVWVGWLANGYLQSVLLELGAAVLLLVPLVLAERGLTRRIGLHVEDGVSEALNATAGIPHPDDASRIEDRVRRLLAGWNLLSAAEPFDFVIEGAARMIALAIRHTPFPLDSATIRRLLTIARGRGIPELVVVSMSPMTQLAADLVRRTPELTVVTDAGLDAELRVLLHPVA